MKIHEFQAKELLKSKGAVVPNSIVIEQLTQARAAAETIGGNRWVVKAQIHAGGRGKGGGVKLANSLDEVEAAAKDILGMQLVTHQTGPDGMEVKKVLIEEASDIDRELYLGMVLDRVEGKVAIMASPMGGTEIEEVAKEHPEQIFKQHIDPAAGLMPYQTRDLAFRLGLKGDQVKQASKFINALYNTYMDYDCSLVEINPLVVTKDGNVLALDAKLDLEDNGLLRHKELLELRDLNEEDASEVEAQDSGLNYIRLDGSIGCMVNGAGLAMATMDIIKLFGSEPANFLDVGGGATAEQVTKAFKIILSDDRVKAILVNIFGGIMRCDIIAEGIITAAKEIGIEVPVVVRLAGTNVEQGKKMLAESGLALIPADDMTDAAKKVVEASK